MAGSRFEQEVLMTNAIPPADAFQRNERGAIERFTAEWSTAMKAKDVERLVSMVTEDVVFLPPGFPPIRGRQAVEAMYRSFFPQFRSVEQEAVSEEVEVMGDWAFAWGLESIVLVPQSDGPPIRMHGKGLSILKRQADGSWKCARAINNSQILATS
jgi:uncharacterized protein (TIGR02246 family)